MIVNRLTDLSIGPHAIDLPLASRLKSISDKTDDDVKAE